MMNTARSRFEAMRVSIAFLAFSSLFLAACGSSESDLPADSAFAAEQPDGSINETPEASEQLDAAVNTSEQASDSTSEAQSSQDALQQSSIADSCEDELWVIPLCPDTHSPAFDEFGGFEAGGGQSFVTLNLRFEGAFLGGWGVNGLGDNALITLSAVPLTSPDIDDARLLHDFVGTCDGFPVQTQQEIIIRGELGAVCQSEYTTGFRWEEGDWFYFLGFSFTAPQLSGGQLDIEELLTTIDAW